MCTMSHRNKRASAARHSSQFCTRIQSRSKKPTSNSGCWRLTLHDHRHAAVVGGIRHVAHDVEAVWARAVSLSRAVLRRVHAGNHELPWAHGLDSNCGQSSVRIVCADTAREHECDAKHARSHPYPRFFWPDARASAKPHRVASIAPQQRPRIPLPPIGNAVLAAGFSSPEPAAFYS